MAQMGKAPRRYDTLTVRLSRIEKALLYAAAAELDITVSEYVRAAVRPQAERDLREKVAVTDRDYGSRGSR